MQPFERSVDQIGKGVGPGQRKSVIELVADLIEVDSIENVGSGCAQVQMEPAVPVDVEGLLEGEVRGGIVCTPVAVTRRMERHGIVAVQGDTVYETWRM